MEIKVITQVFEIAILFFIQTFKYYHKYYYIILSIIFDNLSVRGYSVTWHHLGLQLSLKKINA